MRNTDRSNPVNGKSGFSFLSGFLSGLGAIAKLGDYRYAPPSINYGSLHDDWQAVGKDMRAAMGARHDHG